MSETKAIAIYLPQFHPIHENNEWWGKGFTEWTNVAKAKPLFKNHLQPRLPSDLGFYDLRNPETRTAQAELAREYGIEGFAYYHYWFKGKRLLERPFEEALKTGSPDFPFCLIWANETWSRRWLGEEKEILIKQEYSAEDDIAHARYLCKAFSDKRYILKDGRPVFVIYRPNDLPNSLATISTIKEICVAEIGVEPFIVGSNSHDLYGNKLLSSGFDAIFNFRPQLSLLPFAFIDGFNKERLWYNFKNFRIASGVKKIYDYAAALAAMQQAEPASFDDVIPTVFVGWDNTARRGENGIVIINTTPDLFEKELVRVKTKAESTQNNFGYIFINAWNEWAEGNHLEPDIENGLAYLEVVKKVFGSKNQVASH